MRRRAIPGVLSGVLSVLITGCFPSGPCPDPNGPSEPDPNQSAQAVYTGTGNPYDLGSLHVRTHDVRRCEHGAPLPLRIHSPTDLGTYAVVVFQHGFLALNSNYDEILAHLASHGFIVVAPQMYDPGLCALFGNPTAAQEAEWAADVLAWLPDHLSLVTGVQAETRRLGMSGHSRGGKIAWLVLSADPNRAQAVAGVDPVDGTGGPGGNQPRVVQGPFNFDFPSLVIGTGLGDGCAPEGDNHVQFYEASASPAWHVVATNQGHADMLDDGCGEAQLEQLICPGGPDRAGMRQLTGGLLAAFFRGSLQGDPNAYSYLSDVQAAPIPVEVESK
jgi:chlorophyllase